MITLIDNEDMRVSAIPSDSSHIALCFTGIGHAFGAIDVQGEEFRHSSNHATSIFVIDKRRSWGNNLDFDAIAGIVESFGPDRVVNTLGNSMGGFLAILATRFVKTTCCVAIVPQYSVHKSVMPLERRWDRYVDQIETWKYVDLADAFDSRTNYYLIAGLGGPDDAQMKMFPRADNIHRILFTNETYRHDVSLHLRNSRVLYDVILDCFSSRPAAQIVTDRLRDPSHGAFAGDP